jgi:long-chain acyl-CoA synthetase
VESQQPGALSLVGSTKGCDRGSVLCGLLDAPAHWFPDGAAILVGDEPVCTWSGLAERVARRATGLRERHDVGPGDTVALFAANCPEYLEILFGIWHAGAVAVPISSRLHAREAAALLDSSRASVCFATPDVADELAAHCPDGTRVVVVGDTEDAALAAAEPSAAAPRSLGDDAWIFFTSGTTGRAKGARLTHGNLLAMTSAYYADVSDVAPGDSIVHVAALSHASGLFSLPFVGRGAAQVLPPSGHFDAGELLSLIAAGRRSTFFVPPTLLHRLCRAEQLSSTPIDRIGRVLVGAAPVRPADLRAGSDALGACLWNGYGQGESPCTITAMSSEAIASALDDGDDERLGSVGVARFATRVRVVGEGDQPLPVGEVGEVVVDGPTVMAGYLDMPGATAETLRGGWLHTGDLGRFDAHGHLTLVDRAKDVVITGGYNVYPSEVEEILLTHPAVAEAAVIGVPDEEWGERVVAYVVAGTDSTVDVAALDARCIDAIARHKRPKEYRIVEELPRNSAGKVLKKELRELHAHEEVAHDTAR